MKHADVERFKRNLESLLGNLEQPLRKRDEIAIETSPDELDQVQHAGDRELAIRKLESDTDRLRSVREAMQRIQDGTYGVCLRCEEEISPKRLDAVPWTPYCLHCQDSAEHEAGRAALAMKIDIKGDAA